MIHIMMYGISAETFKKLWNIDVIDDFYAYEEDNYIFYDILIKNVEKIEMTETNSGKGIKMSYKKEKCEMGCIMGLDKFREISIR